MNLSFLNPYFLLGLPLIFIPVIIHLLTKKKAYTVRFSDIRFIKLASEKLIKRHKINQLLILLLRVLTIFILTLLFARPVFEIFPLAKKGSQNSIITVIMLDNSYSMGYRENQRARFDTATRCARKIISFLQPGNVAALLSVSDRVEDKIDFTTDMSIISGGIDDISLSNYPSDLNPGMKEAYLMLSNMDSVNKQVIVISDMAKNGYDNIDYTNIDNFDPNVKLIFVDIANNNSGNSAVIDVKSLRPLEGENVEITSVFKNYHDNTVSLLAELFVNEKKEGQGFVSIDKSDIAEKDFYYTFPEKGEYTGSIRILEDSLAIDNIFYFADDVAERIRVLCVDGNPGLGSFAGDTFYIKKALAPYSGKGRLIADVVTVDEFILTDVGLYRVLVLCNVVSLKQNMIDRLYEYVRGGGNIIIFAGDNVNVQLYNSVFKHILPASLEGVNTSTLSRNSFSKIASVDYKHPALGIFSDSGQGILNTAQFYKYIVMKPHINSSVLLEFENKDPFIIEGSLPYSGSGKVMIFSSTADRDWNDFPSKPAYVSLLQEICGYLVSPRDVSTVKAFSVGELFSRSFKAENLPLSAFIINPENQKKACLRLDSPDFTGFQFNELNMPGIYQLHFQRDNVSVTEPFAVNLNLMTNESDVSKITSKALKIVFPESEVFSIGYTENLDKKLVKILRGKELARSLALIVIVLLMAEVYLANRKKV